MEEPRFSSSVQEKVFGRFDGGGTTISPVLAGSTVNKIG